MRYIQFLLLIVCFSSKAQLQISGVVKDATTSKGLPFASLNTTSGWSTVTDVDGKFSLRFNDIPTEITLSYVGYEPKTIVIDSSTTFLTIKLTPLLHELSEITIYSENKALKIMESVFRNKSDNDPQKKLSNFQFDSYNKLLVSADPDSLSGRIDSIYTFSEGQKKLLKIDSSEYRFKKLMKRQHLFLAEKNSHFQYQKPVLKETVTGARMAGFKEPIYEYYGFELQSFSIYDNKYELFETKYRSPLHKAYATDYRYRLLDSTSLNNREVFIIHFRNKKIRKGLEGLLYIDKKNFAVAKAVMRIRNVLNITGIHEFSYFPEHQIWFPVTRKFTIVKGRGKEETKILGGRIIFQADDDSNNTSKKSDDYTYLSSETSISNILFDEKITIKKSFISVEVKDNANEKTEAFWSQKRKDPFDTRSIETYRVLDSIVLKNNIERKIRFGRKIINGYIPIGIFDFDLRQLLSYNNYEGFRFGAGFQTNELFSKKFRIEGYSAYGMKDDQIKYQIGAATRIGKFSNSWIGGSYTDDLREIASTTFAIDKRIFKLYDPRPINISTFYNHKTFRAYIETKIIPKTESIWQLTRSSITPLFEYSFLHDGEEFRDFSITSALVSIQWNPFSDYMQTPNGKLEIEKRFPKFTFQFMKTIPSILENSFDFGKVDLRIDYEKKYLNGDKSTILAQAGYAFGALPITHLYNTSPNNLNRDNLLQRITIAGKNSFETMFFNEFFSSEFVYLQLKHGFKRVALFKKIRPSFVMVTRMAWGDLQNPEKHSGIEFKTLNRGFFESGVELNQIYKGFGLSAFYRYGPNQLSRLEDNIALKINFILDLGLD